MNSTISMFLSIFDQRSRRQFGMILVLMVVSALFETAGLAGILPFLSLLAKPELAETNSILAGIYAFFGFSSFSNFAIFIGVVVFVLVLLSLAIKAFTLYASTRFCMSQSHKISTRLMAGYLRQPYTWFLSRHSSELSRSVLADVDQVIADSLLPVTRLLTALTVAMAIIGLLILVEPIIAAGAFVILGGAYLGIYTAFRRWLVRLGRRRLAANSRRFRILQEAMGGIKEVKYTGLESRFEGQFRHAAKDMARARTAATVLSQMPRMALEALAFGGLIAAILYMVASRGGDLGAVLPVMGLIAVAAIRLFPALQQIYAQIATMRQADPVLRGIHAELNSIPPEMAGKRALSRAESASAERLLPAREITLDAVGYSYPEADRTALKGLSLTVPVGSRVGIVGGTGAGKTTVIDILLGLLQPEEGALIVDGTAVTPDRLRAWQNALGYVPQQIHLSDKSVAANIAFGQAEDEIDMEAVERAARMASLHEFVLSELPEGYDTMVGDEGVRLSGGQRQRIGIARALYHDPSVLIMDEATSALDNITERAVMDAIYNVGAEKTVLMVAHRLTTVQNCDVIFVLEHGCVAAQGTYDQLVKGNDTFRKMVNAV